MTDSATPNNEAPAPEAAPAPVPLIWTPAEPVYAEPGFYPSMPWEQYIALPYANSSVVRTFDTKSAFHAQDQILHGVEETDAMRRGSGLHKLILERDGFFDEWAVYDGVERDADPKSKIPANREGPWRDYTLRTKEARLKFESMGEGKRGVLRNEDYQSLLATEVLLEAHGHAMRLLRGPGHTECVLIWDDEGSGLRCKCRLDRFIELSSGPLVIDLKQCPDCSKPKFKNKVANEALEVQAGFYMNGIEAVFGKREAFAHIAIESTAPYGMGFYELDPVDLNSGSDAAKTHLRTWSECLESGVWPCFAEKMHLLSLPPWAREPRNDWIFAGV